MNQDSVLSFCQPFDGRLADEIRMVSVTMPGFFKLEILLLATLSIITVTVTESTVTVHAFKPITEEFFPKPYTHMNKAVYTGGLVAYCWVGAITILDTQLQVLSWLLLIVFIGHIILSCQFGSFL